MDKLLVVGGSGLLGSKLLERCEGTFSVFATYKTHALRGKNSLMLDVTDRGATLKLVKRIKPDYVIDTHALTNLDYCETHKEEAWEVNVKGTQNVAEACRELGCKYVFMSTDSVFDGKRKRYVEDDETNPLNYYGVTKLAAERAIEEIGVDQFIARTSVIYGRGGMNKVNFVSWLVEKLSKGEKVNIVVDQYNNPTLVDNLVELLLTLVENDAEGVFHATGRNCISRYDFALQIANAFSLDNGLINPITTPELKQIAKRPERVNMCVTKAERASGVKMLTTEEGLNVLKSEK